MPRLIDRDQRSAEITEAAWRVLASGGVRGVSVRNVAQEARLATASLRRAFPTQAALLAACLTLMGDRVAARIAALPDEADPVEQAVAALAQTLPLDEERRLEMEVYLTLGTAALTDPGLRAAYRTISDDLGRLCAFVVDGLLSDGGPAHRRREAAHLRALVDGLALHVLHGDDADQALVVLRAHLSRLAHG